MNKHSHWYMVSYIIIYKNGIKGTGYMYSKSSSGYMSRKKLENELIPFIKETSIKDTENKLESINKVILTNVSYLGYVPDVLMTE